MAREVQHFIYSLNASPDNGYSVGEGLAVSPENFWKGALEAATDEWGLSGGFRIIRPGDWVWVYFVRPIGQVVGVGHVTDLPVWRDDWQRHSVKIRWDSALTRELKKNPIHYEEYRQLVLRSAVRAKPATLEVFEEHLGHSGYKTALAASERVQFAQRQVMERLGQHAFRARVLHDYNGVCAITGCSETGALQAAHILPVRRAGTHAISNSVLLRADLHNLFDLGLITVDRQLRIQVDDEVVDEDYRKLAGQEIRIPRGADRQEVIEAYAGHKALYGK